MLASGMDRRTALKALGSVAAEAALSRISFAAGYGVTMKLLRGPELSVALWNASFLLAKAPR